MTLSAFIRRWEDESPDLWTPLNLIQENILKGGAAYINPENRSRKRRTVKRITSIDETD